MDDLVMNYIEDDDLTEEEYYSGFYNSNLKVDPNQLLTENKDMQNGLYSFDQLQDSIASNEIPQNLEEGASSASTNEEKSFQNEEILPPIDALSSIVIVKVETVTDDSSTFNTPHKQELPSETLNGATNDDTKKITFKCDFCFFIGTSRFALARHKEKCKAVEPSMTELSEKLEDEKHSKVLTFNCDVCDFFATSRFALARHKNIHQNKEVEDKKRIIFNCEFCSFSASSRFALARHQEGHKGHSDINEEKCVPVETTNQIIPKMRVFKCRWCHFTSKFRFALKRHALSHRKADTFTCSRCYNLVLTESKGEHLLKCKKKCEHYTCDNCPYKTVYKKMFVNHQNTCKKELSTLEVPVTIQQHQKTGQNESNHKCKYCPFTTKLYLTLTKHLKSHKSVRPLVKYPKVHATDKQHQTIVKNEHYQCKYCSFSTKFQWKLSDHIRAHTLGRPIFKCKHCSFKSTYSALNRHNQSKPPCFVKNNVEIDGRRSKDALKCDQCSFKTSWKAAWHKHLISHGGQTGRSAKFIKCQKCSFKTHWKATLENHLRSHEHNMQNINARIRNKIIECKEGSSNTELMAARDTHKKSDMSSVKSGSTNNTTEDDQSAQNVNTNYKCKYCSLTVTRLQSFKLHIEKHTKLKLPVYKCEKCDFTGFKVTVGRHMTIKHDNKKTSKQTWATSHLGSYHTNDKNLKKNLSIHEGEKIETSPRDTLIKGINKLRCDLCSYTTISKQQINHHYKMHIKNKPLVQCTLCDYKSFRRQLTRHYKNVHNKVKINNHVMYYCKFCSFSSKFRPSLHFHTRNQHMLRKSDMYECDYCEFYSTKYSLAMHVSRVHRQAKDSSCD